MPLFLRNILWSPCNESVTWSRISKKQKKMHEFWGKREKKVELGVNFLIQIFIFWMLPSRSVFSKGLAHFSKCAKLLQVLQRHASVQMLHISTASWNVYFINSLNTPPLRPRSQLCVLGWGVTMIHETTFRVYANFTKSKAWSAIQVYFSLPHLSNLDC